MENIDKKSSNKSKLSIATYNFFIRPPGIGKKEYKDLRCNNFASFMHEIGFNNTNSSKINAELDIICFQEVFTPLVSNRMNKMIQSVKTTLGLNYCRAGPK